MPGIPTGLVTFLFTDIEGSTRLWETHPKQMQEAFHRQEALLRNTVASFGGYAYKMVGDAFQVAFQDPCQAVRAAVEIQRVLARETWGETVIHIRMALHTCLTEERGDDYVGPELNRLARLMNSGHGGQILLTQFTVDSLGGQLNDELRLLYLGQHYLKDLLQPEHIYQVAAEGLREQFPPLKTLNSLSRSIRLKSTSFVGRKQEIEEISGLLMDKTNPVRLISLVGQGGVGKTRLAMQISARLLSFYPEGVFFIDLTTCSSQEELLVKIGRSMNFQFLREQEADFAQQSTLNQLIQYLGWKKILLVLDNFEHLVEHTELVSEILAGTQNVQILVTSRERLNLPEEWVALLSGLPLPEAGGLQAIRASEAVDLFVTCAERSGLRLISEQDWYEISRICRLVDGLPLGIELAAAWVRMFSLAEIREKVEISLDFLQESQRGHPDRQRSLRAVFEHSWNLLSQEERTVLKRLSIFLTDFRVDAAVEVARASLITLSSLLDKSLLKRLANGRLLIHPILLQFVTEKRKEDPHDQAETEVRFSLYYADRLGKLGENLFGGEYLSVRDFLQEEKEHFIKAWRILVQRDEFVRLRPLIPIVTLAYDMFGSRKEGAQEMRCLFERLHSRQSRPDWEKNQDIYALARASFRMLSDFSSDEADQIQAECLAIARQLPLSREKAYLHFLCCTGNRVLGLDELVQLIQECVQYFSDLGDRWGKALSLLLLGDALNFNGELLEQARNSYHSSLELFGGLNNRWGQALCFHGLAIVEKKAGNLPLAYELNAQSLELYEHLQNVERSIPVRHFQAELACAMGQAALARDLYQVNLEYFSRVGNQAAQDFYARLVNQMEHPV